MVEINNKEVWDELSKYVIGYIGEIDREHPRNARGIIGKKVDCRYDIENINMFYDGKNQSGLGTYAKDGYMFVDCDGFNKQANGQYGDLRNPICFKNALLGEGVSTILIKTTHGGYNALFKIPNGVKWKSTDYITQSTLHCEFKIGGSKITVAEYGKQREMIKLGDGIDELPKWLYPTQAVANGAWNNVHQNSLIDAVSEAGFQIDKYIKAVLPVYGKKAGLTLDDCVNTYEVIKEYVAPNMIEDDTYNHQVIESIGVKYNEFAKNIKSVSTKSDDKTREYANEFYETAKPLLMIVNNGVKVKDRIGYYMFDGITYKEFDIDDMARHIHNQHEDWDTLKGEQAFKYMKRDNTQATARFNNFNYNKFTPCTNGVINTDTGEFIEDGNCANHKNTLFINCKYVEEYKEDATSRLIDNFMSTIACGDDEIVQFLWMWLGLCLAKSTPLDKILFMYGSGENLKSYFMSMVENVFPSINRPINKLGGDFGCEGVDNGFVLYSTEMFKGDMSDLCGDITRQISSQDTISINGKHVSAYQNRPFCKMMYATNDEVKLGTGKNAKRRTIYVPFNWNRKTHKGVDEQLLVQLGLDVKSMKYWLSNDYQVRLYVLHKAVDGLRRFLDSSKDLNYDSDVTLLPQKCIELTESFLLCNDSVGEWIKFNDITHDKLLVQNSKLSQHDWYELYVQWQSDQLAEEYDGKELILKKSERIVKESTFKKRIYSEFNFEPTNSPKKIEGKVIRGFKDM